MKLMAQGSAELRYGVAWLVPGAGFLAAAARDLPAMVVVGPMVLLFFLWTYGVSGSAASWLELDSQEVVAHFTLRPAERIPLGRIAAVEVHRRRWGSSSWRRLTFITIFRKDVPAVIEIRAESWEAEPFLFQLARNAKLLGLADVAPFAVPRRHWVHDLLPLVPAIAIFSLFPFRFSWSSFVLALGAFVIHSALASRRFAKLAKDVAAGTTPPRLRTWRKLLRSA